MLIFDLYATSKTHIKKYMEKNSACVIVWHEEYFAEYIYCFVISFEISHKKSEILQMINGCQDYFRFRLRFVINV